MQPEPFAGAIAPVIDRVRIGIARQIPERAASLLERLGLGTPAAYVLGMLRNTMPDRAVSHDAVYAVHLYTPRSDVDASLDRLGRAGLVEPADTDSLRLTGLGREVVEEMLRITADIVDTLWAGHEATVATLDPITARAAAAAQETGGPASTVMMPAYEPAGASQALLVAERLTPLRFHRFDAHARAWQEAGLTVEGIQSLGPGPERDAIEHATNRYAAPPYAVLDDDERFSLLAGLAALPN